jgi:hypothetical protein
MDEGDGPWSTQTVVDHYPRSSKEQTEDDKQPHRTHTTYTGYRLPASRVPADGCMRVGGHNNTAAPHSPLGPADAHLGRVFPWRCGANSRD